MKKIVILGSSAAGAKAIEEVRRTDPSSEITVIAFDGHYPYRRDAFASFIANEIEPKDVFCRSMDFYERHRVNVILDKTISRVNLKRRKILTEEKEQIDYDTLIVTDTPENRFPDIRGTHKDGVFGYRKLKDIDQIVNILPLIETVAVQSDSFSGLQAALAFVKRKKETILISSEDSFLNRHFEAETLEWLMGAFEEKGLRIMRASAISEILGDRDAKAVRLQSGKVFAAEVVLFGETDEDLRLFSNSDLKVNGKINVDAQCRTNIAGVFAVDQACSLSVSDPVTPLSVLEEQGKAVAAAVSGEEQPICWPVRLRHLNTERLAITVLGETKVSEEIEVRRAFNRESGAYEGLYTDNNRLVGAVLINNEGKKSELLRSINEKTDIGPAQKEAAKAVEPSSREGDMTETGSENVSTELVDN